MASVCLLVLCGIPGAGKSTWAENFIKYNEESANIEKPTANVNIRKGNLHSNKSSDNAGNNEQRNVRRTDSGEKYHKETGDGERLQWGRVIHIAYDEVIPEEFEAELIHDAKNHSKEAKSICWKNCRKTIAICVEGLVKELLSVEKLSRQVICSGKAMQQVLTDPLVSLNETTRSVQADLCSRQRQITPDSARTLLLPCDLTNYSANQLKGDFVRYQELYKQPNNQVNNPFITEDLTNCQNLGQPKEAFNISVNFSDHTKQTNSVATTENIDEEVSLAVEPCGPFADGLRRNFNDLIKRQMKGDKTDSVRWILLIDDNMYYSSMRYEYFQIARKYMAGFALLFFPVDVTAALQRNQKRKRRVEESVICEMFEKLEQPCSENSWERFSATWSDEDPERMNFQKVLRLIEEAISNPMLPLDHGKNDLEEARMVCSMSLLHQADIVLRRILNLHLSAAKDNAKDKAERSRQATLCNSVRQHVLENLRSQVLLIPESAAVEVRNAPEDANNAFHLFLKDVFYDQLKHFL